MSKQNNVNPGQYKDGGRLKPDEIAREREKQQSLEPPDVHRPDRRNEDEEHSGRRRDKE